MTRSVDVGLREARNAFEGEGEGGVILLAEDLVHETSLTEPVHHVWRKVTLQAARGGDVDLEVGVLKWSILHTSSAGVAGNVERVLLRRQFDIGPVTTEAGARVEDGCLKDGSAVKVCGRGVDRPVPVSV